MKIPFSPPFVNQRVIDEVLETLESGWITSGPKVKALEQEIVSLTDSKVAICVNSWTSGAILMLKWFGIKAGDEVIIPAYTYSATALSVLHCGATPVMVDVTDDFTVDPEKIKAAITSKTKVIMPVDIGGWPCDYNAIVDLVKQENIKALFKPESDKQIQLGRILVLSDAAHSIGALYNGESAAKICDITIFSFHAVKNITTAEGGCICLNLPEGFDHEAEYKFLKMFSLNGQNKDALAKSKIGAGSWKYDILFQGLKINMPDLCAAVGLAQLQLYHDNLLPDRKSIAMRYNDGFSKFDWYIAPPLVDAVRESSYHLFPLRIKGITEEQRDQIIEDVMQMGVSVNVHFIPMPMLTLFKDFGYNIKDYPVAYKNYAAEISLPIYPELSADKVDYIIASVVQAVKSNTQ